MGAVDRHGRGYSFDYRDIGTDVTDQAARAPAREACREPFPKGHRFFHDCLRETEARTIEWSLRVGGVSSWFITLTFKHMVSEAQAYRLLNEWASRLQKSYMSKINVLRSHGVRWTVAQEWQKRGVIHFHLILSGVRLDELSRKRWEHRWSGIGGGYARIYPARPKSAPYLAKYVGKTDTRNGELRRGGNWQGITPPRAIGCCQAKLPG